jgi:hypothetical protein
MATIGDLFLMLKADDSGLQAQVQTAGTKAGGSFSSKFGSAAKVGLGAVGAAGGLLLGVAAKGGQELTDAMANFQRETGATVEELESAQHSVAELSRSNIQGFDEIARSQAALRTELGLTQEEAEAATQAFLDYGTATGRDAADGVSALDDILDAWNLDSSKSGEIMDKLIESHQQYGGSISENEDALNRLAPALQALNLDVDDGISLLNLFQESGLDASKAQAALNAAITKLPEGTSLEEFVAHLATIEDPAERARQAIEVFGARGGAGLANAIKPGMTGLDDFAVGMDEAAGATQEASEAIENTPFNQLKIALKNLAGPLAEVGTNFGPLILGFSSLGGGKLVGAAASALGAFGSKAIPILLTSLAGILPAITGAVTGLGAAIAGLIPVGMALLPVLLVAAIVGAIVLLIANPELRAKAFEVGGTIVGAIVDALKAIIGFVADIVRRVVEFFGGMATGVVSTILGIPGRVIAWVGSLVGQAVSAGGQFLSAVASAIGSVVATILGLPGRVVAWVGSVVGQARDAAARFLSAIAGAVGSVVGLIVSIPGRIVGIIGGIAGVAGRAAGALLGPIGSAIRTIGGWINGLLAKLGLVEQRSFQVRRGIVSMNDILANYRGARAEGGPVMGGATYLVGEAGPELFVPSTSGRIVPNLELQSSTAVGGGSSNTTVNVNAHLEGLPMRARTPLEVAQQLRRVASMGLIGPSPRLVPSNG